MRITLKILLSVSRNNKLFCQESKAHIQLHCAMWNQNILPRFSIVLAHIVCGVFTIFDSCP